MDGVRCNRSLDEMTRRLSSPLCCTGGVAWRWLHSALRVLAVRDVTIGRLLCELPQTVWTLHAIVGQSAGPDWQAGQRLPLLDRLVDGFPRLNRLLQPRPLLPPLADLLLPLPSLPLSSSLDLHLNQLRLHFP